MDSNINSYIARANVFIRQLDTARETMNKTKQLSPEQKKHVDRLITTILNDTNFDINKKESMEILNNIIETLKSDNKLTKRISNVFKINVSNAVSYSEINNSINILKGNLILRATQQTEKKEEEAKARAQEEAKAREQEEAKTRAQEEAKKLAALKPHFKVLGLSTDKLPSKEEINREHRALQRKHNPDMAENVAKVHNAKSPEEATKLRNEFIKKTQDLNSAFEAIRDYYRENNLW